ncbi:GH13740 [Drosophila grimshawi]|uniref:GH13740 n=2 Tax=Drosophila grimshawi TaxID=7222 RepID=B4JQQ9_DROGR|nr:GH13740 [Drosophila grimshawi]
MSNQLGVLKDKLENQVAQDINQNEQLEELNYKVKQLYGTINTLNDICKNLESAEDKSTKQRQDITCECGTSKTTANCARLKIKHALERKTSSLCQFCKNKNLPVLGSMKDELSNMMGDLTVRDVALTILLRSDNIYHVNLRDMETGGDLGCMLVNYDGIQEANNLGLFKDILTICVTDVRNTIESKEAISGVLNFEFIKVKR